jgi:DNA (cytosine-5)-methyltransferase 1
MGRLTGVSLFSGAGIGDLGFRAAGIRLVSMTELEPDRAALARLNFPEAHVFVGDVGGLSGAICEHAASGGDDLFLLSCTAPCQGMSKNGKGTLLNNVRKGERPELDPRNRLVLPAIEMAKRLRPRWVVFENVPEMRRTVIRDHAGALRPILDVVFDSLAPDYVGEAYDVAFADYGVPQRRQRLITVLTRDRVARGRFESGVPLIPPRTHARDVGGTLHPWVSVAEVLKDFPPLDGADKAHASCPGMPFHRVPVLDPKKYEWVRHTPPGRSAFDNQCANPACGFQGNRTHGAGHTAEGINRSHKDTPLYCERCGSLLPRPYTDGGRGGRRIMSGYTSAYKRMDGSLPAPALTRNLSFPCSDQKIHPTQNRVLSLAEAMTLQTIDRYGYRWGPLDGRGRKRDAAPDTLIRLVIGESVPPLFFEALGQYLVGLGAPRSALARRLPVVDGA